VAIDEGGHDERAAAIDHPRGPTAPGADGGSPHRPDAVAGDADGIQHPAAIPGPHPSIDQGDVKDAGIAEAGPHSIAAAPVAIMPGRVISSAIAIPSRPTAPTDTTAPLRFASPIL
jgi:hypothetical protein